MSIKTVFYMVCAISLSFISFSSLAQRTGNDVLNDCPIVYDTSNAASPQQLFSGMDCVGYIAGINDMAALMQGLNKTNLYCLPKKQGLETGQILRVFLKWLQEHPETLHESARSLFISAMKDNFPCN